MNDIRSQIAVNLRIILPSLPPLGQGAEVITAYTGDGNEDCNGFSAYLCLNQRSPTKVLMKGPGRNDSAQALSGLLDLTAGLMRAKHGLFLQDFEKQDVQQSGGGLLLKTMLGEMHRDR
jgi:hypothetical protein